MRSPCHGGAPDGLRNTPSHQYSPPRISHSCPRATSLAPWGALWGPNRHGVRKRSAPHVGTLLAMYLFADVIRPIKESAPCQTWITHRRLLKWWKITSTAPRRYTTHRSVSVTVAAA